MNAEKLAKKQYGTPEDDGSFDTTKDLENTSVGEEEVSDIEVMEFGHSETTSHSQEEESLGDEHRYIEDVPKETAEENIPLEEQATISDTKKENGNYTGSDSHKKKNTSSISNPISETTSDKMRARPSPKVSGGILKSPEGIQSTLGNTSKTKINIDTQRNVPVGSYQYKRKSVHFSDPYSMPQNDSTVNAEELMKIRGIQMTNTQTKIFTPVKVEFNSTPETVDFSVIEKTQILLNLFNASDPYLKIFDVDKKVILFEQGSDIPVGEEFEKLFKARRQTFQKGNRKFTVYFHVESTLTIQNLKYKAPTKKFIFDNNIWIKPDFFDTKIESSPGYFTLIHPKISNKVDYKEYLLNILHSMSLDKNEPVVQKWYESHGMDVNKNVSSVPQFHLKTGLKKWGQIHTEVLKVICSVGDSEFIKYLFSKVGEMEVLQNGLFIPEGLHLLEGKEVVTKLLTEHKKFINDTTSIQVEGISLEDMNRFNTERNNTLKEFLLEALGVLAVERTFFTTNRGQWLLVIKRNYTAKVRAFFEAQLSAIYNSKRDCKVRLLTYQEQKSNSAYRLQVIQDCLGKVSSYAEVLTRRFASRNSTEKNKDTDSATPGNARNNGYQANDLLADADSFPPLSSNNEKNNSNVLPEDTKDKKDLSKVVQKRTNSQSSESLLSSEQNKRDGELNSSSSEVPGSTLISSTIEKLRLENRRQMEKIAVTLEEKMEKLFDSKMVELSDTVATTVAVQLLRSMKGLFSKTKNTAQTEPNPSTPISESRETKLSNVVVSQSGEKSPKQKKFIPHSSTDMLSELNRIEKQQKNAKDLPHDATTPRSLEGT